MTKRAATAFLEVRDLKKYFPVRGGLFQRVVAQVRAVDGVSFSLARGRTYGLVGESGCGKSTLGRAILRLHEPTAGRVCVDGHDIVPLGRTELTAYRRRMQIIFQDPFASLSPQTKNMIGAAAVITAVVSMAAAGLFLLSQ